MACAFHLKSHIKVSQPSSQDQDPRNQNNLSAQIKTIIHDKNQCRKKPSIKITILQSSSLTEQNLGTEDHNQEVGKSPQIKKSRSRTHRTETEI